jgi:peptidoglycan/xylan/chitin deacetylase (PgdA/CDA1 family)
MLVAVNYHYIRDSFDTPFPGIHGVTPVQFEEQLKLLARAGEFVSADQIRAAVRGDQVLPERAISVTFDDGLREQYEHALPILRRLGIPAIFFINTAPIASCRVLPVHKIHLLRAHVAPAEFTRLLQRHAADQGITLDLERECEAASLHYNYDSPEAARLKYLLNFLLNPDQRDRLVEVLFAEVFTGQESAISRGLYMDVGQIRELSRHACIGTHAHEHLPLGLLPPALAEKQIEMSLAYLAEWSGYRPFALSYPYGAHNVCSRGVGETAERLGVEFAFTMERAGNRDLRQRMHLARFDCNDLPGGKAAQWEPEDMFEQIPASNWYGQPESELCSKVA